MGKEEGGRAEKAEERHHVTAASVAGPIGAAFFLLSSARIDDGFPRPATRQPAQKYGTVTHKTRTRFWVSIASGAFPGR